tara:strand:- start:543 stop:935 length:393 start_codon:yes stop_codon:yes gene_type:complete
MFKYLFLTISLCLCFFISNYDIDLKNLKVTKSAINSNYQFTFNFILENIPNRYIAKALIIDYEFEEQRFRYIDEMSTSTCKGKGTILICNIRLYNEDFLDHHDYQLPIRSTKALDEIIMPIRYGAFTRLY